MRWASDPANPGKVAVEVTGLDVTSLRQMANWQPAQWQRLLSVFAGQPVAGLPPMLGTYRIRSNVLRFDPQFPIEHGVSYQAVFHPDRLPGASGKAIAPITSTFGLPPRNATPTTVVSRIYPSADVVPENLLKFYIHFSAPMSRGYIYDHIRLLDGAGKQVELPFLEIDEELWDPELKRLTLFIDPGRIKRGVKPLEEIGPSLEAGKSYRLVIGREWLDGTGTPLKEGFQKEFKVAPPDREPPDPARWQIISPKSGTQDLLVVAFNEAMDNALARRMITVKTESGELVGGTVALADRERRWVFTPAAAWKPGRYSLIIQTTLEDLAGNNIGKPFEVDLFEGVERRLTTSTVKLSFEIR